MKSLVERILDGDQKAVVEFYTTHSPKVFIYLQRKLPNESDAQELLQDTFLEALDSLAVFQQKCSLSTWLFRIAHNKLVDYYRRKKIKSILLSKFPFLELVAREIHQPEFQYEKNKLRDSIEITFHKLSSRYRNILRLHYEQGLSVKQIALDLNLSFKATESLLYRARQDFIKKYEEK